MSEREQTVKHHLASGHVSDTRSLFWGLKAWAAVPATQGAPELEWMRKYVSGHMGLYWILFILAVMNMRVIVVLSGGHITQKPHGSWAPLKTGEVLSK